ncbi:yrdC domain-containing protein, mitochondrial [Leguminivora glycinivorella]|uniref:yrdC domain-containing protein, mitochondrial n=1 Tax=Leguminivora glycinivorella TaxID=1035111 RepID=UPI00200F4AFC|nr:yrdC domain-containing protein, mitochondrial [Leguminivora glycinivorella]
MNLMKRLNIFSSLLISRSASLKMKIERMAPVIPISLETSSSKAAEYLATGQVIAVPTDTIYGLACSANCPEAIKKLYSIKGRDSAKPVAICVTYIDNVRKWGNAGHLSDDLLNSLLPGPVTVVLEKTKELNNPYLNPKTTKIGIRIPDHSFINKVTENFDMPIALTSANFSNEPSTLSVKEFEHLYCHLGAVFDGGMLSQGLDQNRTGSTVVDLSKIGCYSIIRRGISYEHVVKVLEENGLTSC